MNESTAVEPTPQAHFRTKQQWNAYINASTTVEQAERRRICLAASTAAGDGPLEERLLRLMVWVGMKLTSWPIHTQESDPWRVLQSGLAWCDQQAWVFLFLAKALYDCDGRALSLYHTDGESGHSMCEVFYNDGWHLFDVHTEHQSTYRSPADGHILSYEELQHVAHIVQAEDHWWQGRDGTGKDGFYRGAKPPLVCPFEWPEDLLP